MAFFSRKARGDQRSIENLFGRIAEDLDPPLKAVWQKLPYYSSGLWNRLRALIWVRSRQCDLNHIVGDVHFLVLALDPRKTILTVHDCGFIHKKKGLTRWLMKKFWLDIPVKRARAITTVSETSQKDIVALTGCDPDKIKVIHNFVSDEFYPANRSTRPERFTILQVGTKKNKNLLGLISAIKGLDCKLVIVGRLDKEQLWALKENNIDFENLVDLELDQLVDVYRSSDMLACVSFEEGFGLPITEAQKCGVPVLTSNVSAMPEVAGEGALLVDPHNIDEIRRGIERIMNEPGLRDTLIEKGTLNVSRFTLQKAAKAYSDLYLQLRLK